MTKKQQHSDFLTLTLKKLHDLEKQAETMTLDEIVEFLTACEFRIAKRLNPDVTECDYQLSLNYSERGLRYQWALSTLIDLMLEHEEGLRQCA